VEQAIEYLQLSDKTLGPDWATTSHFRFGASGLLQDALARIDTAGGASGISSDY
jgi:deoxyribose-phosphate aldolase